MIFEWPFSKNMSNFEHPWGLSPAYCGGMPYSFSIRSGDGRDREILGSIDLLNDHAALAFGNDVIRDMKRDNVNQYIGWKMDIAEGERAVCRVAFPALSPQVACGP
jgi:hypothetical protein